MKTNEPKWLTEILQVVYKHEPDVARRMHATEWPVIVVRQDNIDDVLFPFLVWGGFEAAGAMVQQVNNAFGITFPQWGDGGMRADAPFEVIHSTWLNRALIEYKAGILGVPAVEFAANVLVHEFRHRELDMSDTEPEAYAASIKFTHELGRPVLVAFEHEAALQFAHRRAA